ncbi:PREDICTED: uncharacterized protein LOC105625112 [Atta cephalotes]|uniref:Uncharacterized protein n=1 Tax=Atta cephalotes TaxID=12957 RepID=A0A158NWD4_ATTCE|nr:PREDICTED: uncharacterized protein LOC105625112 [Atta cephalotes]
MSLTLTLSGKSTVLATNYILAIDLSDGDYELGLAIFETYHTILNKFYFTKDDAEITIPEDSYEVILHRYEPQVRLQLWNEVGVQIIPLDVPRYYIKIRGFVNIANWQMMRAERHNRNERSESIFGKKRTFFWWIFLAELFCLRSYKSDPEPEDCNCKNHKFILYCYGKFNNCAIRLPSEDKWLSFSNCRKKKRIHSWFYSDLECTLENIKIDMKTFSYTYQQHRVFSLAYYADCSYDNSLYLMPKKIKAELGNVHSTSASVFATVYNWVNDFKRGHTSTCDAPDPIEAAKNYR